MKKYAVPIALVGLLSLQACNQQPPAGADAAADSAAAAAPEVMLDSSGKRLSYGLAFGIGQRMASEQFPLDNAAFLKGIEDSLNGTDPMITQAEMQTEMQAFQEKMMEEQQASQAILGEANQAASVEFLEANAAREGVMVTESGLQYEVLEQGEGAKPGPDDIVQVHYRGTTVDGTEFDSSYSRGQPVEFGVGQVIPGWTEALQLMNVGSKYMLAIPSELAYGAGGAGQVIGPNAALVFEVELLSIPSQVAADTGSE